MIEVKGRVICVDGDVYPLHVAFNTIADLQAGMGAIGERGVFLYDEKKAEFITIPSQMIKEVRWSYTNGNQINLTDKK